MVTGNCTAIKRQRRRTTFRYSNTIEHFNRLIKIIILFEVSHRAWKNYASNLCCKKSTT